MSERWIDQLKMALQQPVPFDTFQFSMSLYEQAARGTMPGYHLKDGPGPDDPQGGLYLTNIPINRGMMAVMRETRHLSDIERQSLTLRLMHFGESLENAQAEPRFAAHFKPSDEDGGVMVSGAFLRAMAECRFVITEDRIGPDMDDLLRLAEQYGAED